MADRWDRAEGYEGFMGRWSRLLAPRFLRWTEFAPGAKVLDIGCGTGALSMALAERGMSVLVGIDRSRPYAAVARRGLPSTHGPAGFFVGDATHLPFKDGSFDAAASALVLNFIADPARALREAERIVRPGGAIAFCVWDYAGPGSFLRHFWDAAVSLDPEHAGPLDEAKRFPICHPGRLAELMEAEGLRDVATTGIDVPTVFRGFEDYWRPFLGGQAPAPGYATGLSPEKREALRERIRSGLPVGRDGRISLVSRAWAVRGTRR